MLENKTTELVNEAKELMGLCIKQMDYHDLKNMDQEEFYAMKKCLKFVDAACELVIEESKMMDDMDRKLDEVLEILRKKEEA